MQLSCQKRAVLQVIPLLVVFHSQKLYTKATGLLQPAANVPGSGGGERPAGARAYKKTEGLGFRLQRLGCAFWV